MCINANPSRRSGPSSLVTSLQPRQEIALFKARSQHGPFVKQDAAEATVTIDIRHGSKHRWPASLRVHTYHSRAEIVDWLVFIRRQFSAEVPGEHAAVTFVDLSFRRRHHNPHAEAISFRKQLGVS